MSTEPPTPPTSSHRRPLVAAAAALALLGAGIGAGFALDRGSHSAPAASAADHGAHHEGGGLDSAAFIDRMVPHHEMAIAMSRSLLARSKNPEMRAVANEIIAMQQREIDQMTEWRRLWTGKGPQALDLSAEELAAMGMTHRADLDTSTDVHSDFLDAMIPHHAGGIVMAERALQMEGQRPELVALAKRIITNQGREIGVMQGYRQNITTYGTPVRPASTAKTPAPPATP